MKVLPRHQGMPTPAEYSGISELHVRDGRRDGFIASQWSLGRDTSEIASVICVSESAVANRLAIIRDRAKQAEQSA